MMSTTSSGELDALIERATSESIPHGELDLPVALEVSDIVRSRRLTPKECMRCLKRRVVNTSDNPNVQLSSWRLIDICIKNGGFPFIKEVCSREFMDTMEHAILKNSDNYDVESLVAKILYELHIAFKNDLQFSYVNRVYEKLVARGVDFPREVQDGSSPLAMFDSRTPADWVDSDVCMICSKKFSLFLRRHHCRSCGGVFCQDHSSNSIVLPDLGIYEPVRVCDDCFENYDSKKHLSNGKKKHHHSGRHKKSKSQAYDEDEQLKKAIELSLKESKGGSDEIIKETTPPAPAPTTEEENDPELKAAIAASLALAEEEKRRRETAQQQQEQWQNQQQQQLQQEQLQQRQLPSLDVTATEEEDIHLFASLVERMKGQSATEILEDTQLQRLYQKVIGSRPKINHALNDTVQKYNSLIDMNTKISDIMNIYDDLLERQLQSINLSERYTVPQGPSDPYTYYQQTRTAPAAQRTAQPPQPIETHAAVAPPQRHLDQIRDLQMPVTETPTGRADLASVPSEPPYPTTEEEMESSVSTPELLTHQRSKSGQETATAPYPVEEESTVKSQSEITNFNFPTVPSRKVIQQEPEHVSEPAAEETAAPPKEEELLIEL
ncbi:hypothetical protein ZYGR_0I02330 [Zygosaccharomyces rouxii]|uniref:Vacuolar protein sorting-associated protein 27 n=1 Tax=Zygosaccharomyces rouxii TaxID=4956 RepID=A0A1Q2ZWV2_ZYGRO|nr:hypothetical protein ZYGR_0I02330 [Zygosaccharomyces rouxii]